MMKGMLPFSKSLRGVLFFKDDEAIFSIDALIEEIVLKSTFGFVARSSLFAMTALVIQTKKEVVENGFK